MAPERPTLDTLARCCDARLRGDGTVLVGDVRHDSRTVQDGDLFVAVTGFRTDGHEFVAVAAAAGAAALCVEHPVAVDLPQLVVADTRQALAPLAAAVHGHPADRLRVVGITGTNGKTTVAHYVEAMAASAGDTPGLIGTLGGRIAGEAVPLPRTTPEASDLQRLLAAMADAGVHLVALEVSSHALALHRADAIHFAVAAFTNLTQDHLDFHGDMEEYFAAKASLFAPGRIGAAVVWVDDPWGRRLLTERLAGDAVTVGTRPDASVMVTADHLDVAGSVVALHTDWGSTTLRLRLPGPFNVANAAVAAAIALTAGYPLDAVAAGAETVQSIDGRYERVDDDRGAGPTVVVDYAHTPAGVAGVVAGSRGLVPGRLVVVVGAAGDRDRTKRAPMGAAAAAADVVFVTSDNPRSEDPGRIVAEVAAGAWAAGAAEVVVEVDRRRAIAAAVAAADTGDLVLILGKGHEQGQDLGDRVVPFDDREVARNAIGART